MKKWIFVLAFCVFYAHSGMAASLVSKLNRNPVPYGEAVVLTVEYDANPKNSKPNFSPLSKDFTVFSIENSFRSSITGNGQISQTYQWVVAMTPKNEGEVLVPSLKLGQSESKPILLKVLSAAEVAKSGEIMSRPKFSISRTIDVPSPFVQQQINYTLLIKTTEALQASEPQFLDNAQNEWIIRSLGQPKISAEIVDGIEVRTIEFLYALFPQKSGNLVIPEVLFNGYYNDPSKIGQASMFGNFFSISQMGFDGILGAQTPVNLSAKPIAIKVKPIPADNNGNWWLPAKSVEIYSSWDEKKPSFKAGEAINREIYVKAVGVMDSQMPAIKFPQVAGLKQYPEKTLSANDVEGEAVVAVMRVNNVYIPEKSGEITIPEVSINWYNIETNRMEVAKLAAYKASVEKGENSIEEVQAQMQADKLETLEPQLEVKSEQSVWKLVVFVVVAFFAGIILAYFAFRPKKPIKAEKKPDEVSDVKENINSANLKGVRDSVILWAKKAYNDDAINNLSDVAQRCKSVDFEEQLELLNLALYSLNSAKDFDVNVFWDEFKLIDKKQKKTKKTQKLLPDLYKKQC